ncbi:right-handed parallel beta-helix repeat-containing protein [Streptomyces sp. SKN60]|uniref:right-handed parallel beta-helix repeat-containing protein n=1 Tax=Streptomyces sp. SKN60 TaxID=2855506 RepID=UPI00224528FB|nr:right-handed parallel beta-helix repeat-containing protein [Streptomyces sp. SKN60]MCX2184390.1 right-handed parallel beta-helix repeat-containing protein [Streptomyces sp. SKN60]
MTRRRTYAALTALALPLLAVAPTAPTAHAAIPPGDRHHVDCTAAGPGDGSVQHPWTTLAEANAHPYGPGDRLLFKRGTTCTGTLDPRGAGSAAYPFTIADYGTAPGRAVIDGGGAHDAVLLANTPYTRLTRLEITNAAAPGSERNGVRLRLADFGAARGITLDHLAIHDVRGGDFKTLTGSSAIHIAVEGTDVPSWYEGLDIHHNDIRDVDREGVYFKSRFSKRDLVGNQQDPNAYPGAWTPSLGVRVHHNTLTSIAGDGIKLDTTRGARVDHNRLDGFQLRSKAANAGIWTFNTDDTVVEYNEVSGGGNTRDGMSFDADGASKGTVFQYNLSHDNKGGFLLICPYSGAQTLDTVVRYNLSTDDGARLVQNCWGPILNTKIYNNTFVSRTAVPGHLVQDDAGSPATTRHELAFRNNVFVNQGAPGGYAFKNPTPGLTFDHNLFHGITMTRPNPGGLTADPLLRPDLRLGAGSPALSAGVPIEDNGGRDWFGNAVSATAAPNIGAYEGPGVN